MSKEPSVAEETPALEAAAGIASDRPLIDIRAECDRQAGTPEGALFISSDELLERLGRDDPGTPRRGWILCGAGIRSLMAVQLLREAGHEGFSSVAGGFLGWKDAGLPVTCPEGLDAEQMERYARHLVMPQVGPAGQRKLLESKMLLVGMGGLNSPVALYLAAAGVGRLGLLDDERVERSNLQRQVLHGESGLGDRKIDSAQSRIAEINPGVHTQVIEGRVDSDNAARLVEGWDIVIDGTDNFTARYALNEACVRLSIPLVYGAVMRFQGQVAVFWPGSERAPGSACFRCLMPREPGAGQAPSCAEAGVLGVLPGIVGTLQANEALKLALGIGSPLVGELLMLDALTMEFKKMKIPANPRCECCGS